MQKYTSLSVWIDAAHSILTEAGYDAGSVLQQFGVDIGKLSDNSVDYFGGYEIGNVWRELARLTGEPAIGLRAAEQYFQPASWRAVGLSVLCSCSLYEAFNRLVRYGDIITNVARFSLDETAEGVYFQVSPRVDPYLLVDEAVDFSFAALMKLIRMIYPGKLAPTYVEFQRKAVDEELYRDYFGCDVHFSTPRLCFHFSHDVVHRLLPMGNAELAACQDRLTDDYKKRFGFDSLVIKVKDEMLRLLPRGEPKPQAVASALHLSVRNMQRKLSNEKTTFSALLTEIRKQQAQDYLQQPYRSCNEISYLLGFSDHSGFTRAFRRWFDKTPTSYREDLAS